MRIEELQEAADTLGITMIRAELQPWILSALAAKIRALIHYRNTSSTRVERGLSSASANSVLPRIQTYLKCMDAVYGKPYACEFLSWRPNGADVWQVGDPDPLTEEQIFAQLRPGAVYDVYALKREVYDAYGETTDASGRNSAQMIRQLEADLERFVSKQSS